MITDGELAIIWEAQRAQRQLRADADAAIYRLEVRCNELRRERDRLASQNAELVKERNIFSNRSAEEKLKNSNLFKENCSLIHENGRLQRENNDLKIKEFSLSETKSSLTRQNEALRKQVATLTQALALQIARTDGLWAALQLALPYLENGALGERTGLRYVDGTPQTVLWKTFDAAFDDTAKSRGLKDPHLLRTMLDVEAEEDALPNGRE